MHTIRLRIAILAGLILLALSPSGAQTVTEAWVQSDANGYPYGSMIALDSQENAVVTGWRWYLEAYIVTKKYDPSGNLLWEQHFSVPDLEVVATWVTIDAFDNVIITGYPRTITSNPVELGLLTIKYDSDGNFLWSDTYSGTWALAVRGITDADGNIYVAGRAWFGTYDFVTIKYAPDGTRLWVDIFDQNSGFHTPNSMDLDSQGHLIINGAGSSGGQITVLYNADGVRQWVIEHALVAGSTVKLTGDGYFFLTGGLYNIPTSDDIWLGKYNLNGNLVWEQTYSLGDSERGQKLAIDSQGNIIVTGTQSINWITIKVDPEGTFLWSNVYDTETNWNEYAGFITVGPDDEVYMTGTGGPCPLHNCTFKSMVTLRYNSDGSNPWVALYYTTSVLGVGLVLASDNSFYVAGDYSLTVIKYVQSGTGSGITCSEISSMAARCVGGGTKTVQVRVNLMNNIIHVGEPVTITIDGSPFTATIISNGTHSRANFSVPGWSVGDHIVSLIDPPGCLADKHATCAASDGLAKGDPEWDDDAAWSGQSVPQATELLGNYPNPFNPSTSIQYALGEETQVTLKIYNTLGQEVATLVNEVQPAGYKTAIWTGRNDTGSPVASGLYIYSLRAGSVVRSERMLLMR